LGRWRCGEVFPKARGVCWVSFCGSSPFEMGEYAGTRGSDCRQNRFASARASACVSVERTASRLSSSVRTRRRSVFRRRYARDMKRFASATARSSACEHHNANANACASACESVPDPQAPPESRNTHPFETAKDPFCFATDSFIPTSPFNFAGYSVVALQNSLLRVRVSFGAQRKSRGRRNSRAQSGDRRRAHTRECMRYRLRACLAEPRR
jgi:hypothetical protein